MSGGLTKSQSTSALLSAPQRTRVKREVRALFKKYDAASDGFIDESDLVNLLRDLTGKEPNKIDLLYAMKAMDTSADGRISFDEMVKYWEAREVGHGGSKYNKLLVKDRVGAPRTSTYDLPPIAHKFGKGAAERVVGTREVLEEWQGGEGEAPRTLLNMPRSPIDVTAKPFGKPGRPSTPVGRIVRCEFAGPAATAKDPIYPAIPSRTKPRSEQAIKTTLAADYRLALTAMRTATDEAATKPWKMKKFAHVRAKIDKTGGPAGGGATGEAAQ